MTLREKIDVVNDGVFHCIFGECETCPYNTEDEQDCSQKLLLDSAEVIMSLDFQIRRIDTICDTIERKQV